jgi:TolA-binding protein
MRTLAAILLTLCVLRINVQAQTPESDLKDLYESHRWFALRKAVAHAPTNLFYKAAVETAFHQDREAQVDLSSYIASHPTSDMLLEARELLLGMDFRSARYQDALVQAQKILSLKPDAKDIANFIPTLKVLAPFVRHYLR